MAAGVAFRLLLLSLGASATLLTVDHKPTHESEYDFTATWRYDGHGQDIQLLSKVRLPSAALISNASRTKKKKKKKKEGNPTFHLKTRVAPCTLGSLLGTSTC
jgi:hypothetical protein